jgi:hypothetical protein
MELNGIKRSKLQRGVCEYGYDPFRILVSNEQLLYHGAPYHIVKTGRFTTIKTNEKTVLSIC